MLIGWLGGPFDGEFYIDDEQMETDSSIFDLAEILQDEEELLEERYSEAYHEKQPAEVISKALEAVKKHKIRCEKAKKYLCDINDELNRGESSALRLDKAFSDHTRNHITLSSLNEWSTKKYSIDILSPNRASIDVQEAQAEAKTLSTSCGEAVSTTKGQLQPRNPPKQRAQENAILAAISKLGYERKSLPKVIQGILGVRGELYDYLKADPLFRTKKTFMLAWDRLLKAGSIASLK